MHNPHSFRSIVLIAVCVTLPWSVLLSAQTPILIENPSFELPGTEKIIGWDSDCSDPSWTGSTEEIPGWTCDVPAFSSGVETGWTPTDGLWTAFLEASDSAVYQITGYVIQEGDAIELDVDSRITWNAQLLEMRMFYADDAGNTYILVAEQFELTNEMAPYSTSFKASDHPECIGKKLGIAFANVSDMTDSWIGLDNVQLFNNKATGIRERQPRPAGFSLSQNYPNPFNPSTEIHYSLQGSSRIRMSVIDPAGREVAVLADGVRGAGEHRVSFSGDGLPSGIYFCRLQSNAGVVTQKMVLQK